MKKTVYYGEKNAEELKKFLGRNLLVGVRKENVLHELPGLRIDNLVLDVGEISEIPKEHQEKVIRYIEADKPIPETYKKVLADIIIDTSERKIKATEEIFAPLIKSGEQILFLGEYKATLDRLKNMYKFASPLVLDGSCSAGERSAIEVAFNKREINPLIAQIKTIIGMNLQMSCNCGAIIEPSFSNSVYKQAIDRLHRKGQTKGVLIYNVRAKDSIDDAIYRVLERKSGVSIR